MLQAPSQCGWWKAVINWSCCWLVRGMGCVCGGIRWECCWCWCWMDNVLPLLLVLPVGETEAESTVINWRWWWWWLLLLLLPAPQSPLFPKVGWLVCRCFLREFFWPKLWWHTSQLYILIPVVCGVLNEIRFGFGLVEISEEEIWFLYLPVWVLSCSMRNRFLMKDFSQYEHLYGLIPGGWKYICFNKMEFNIFGIKIDN